jgi:ribosome-associated translation inhibitor RaiA
VDVVIANGRRIVPDGVRALVEEKVGRLGRYCPGLERAEVRFSEEHNPRIVDRENCEVIMT